MTYLPRNILVTGGMGFIGSNFIESVLKDADEVNIINIDKLTYAASSENITRLNNLENHIFIQGDICDAELIEGIFKEYDIDTVVNFAAESHVDNSISNPESFIVSNICGTFNLLEQARKSWSQYHKSKNLRFHHVSTDEVYGSIDENKAPVKENETYNPSSPYAASKASSDHLVLSYYKTYGMPVSLSHCSNNYGPYQHKEKFIPVVIDACKKQKKIPLYGDGTNRRDWIHVYDHNKAIWEIIQNEVVGQKYNIPGGFEISNKDLALMICRIMDEIEPKEASHQELITFVNDRPGHDWRYSISGEKILKHCGWQAEINFQYGLSDTVKWYLNNT